MLENTLIDNRELDVHFAEAMKRTDKKTGETTPEYLARIGMSTEEFKAQCDRVLYLQKRAGTYQPASS